MQDALRLLFFFWYSKLQCHKAPQQDCSLLCVASLTAEQTAVRSKPEHCGVHRSLEITSLDWLPSSEISYSCSSWLSRDVSSILLLLLCLEDHTRRDTQGWWTSTNMFVTAFILLIMPESGGRIYKQLNNINPKLYSDMFHCSASCHCAIYCFVAWREAEVVYKITKYCVTLTGLQYKHQSYCRSYSIL